MENAKINIIEVFNAMKRKFRFIRGVFYILILLSLLIVGCGGDSGANDNAEAVGLHRDSRLNVGGINRIFDYYIPDNLGTQPIPLVFLLHGGGSSPDDLTGVSGYKAPYKVWMDIADSEKIILVYPQGTKNPAGGFGWNDCRGDATTNPTVDDVAFIEALINYFSNRFYLDENRIYATGTSNGGHMSLRLAIELSDKIAAVAPVVAAMPAVNNCTVSAQAISILMMNGSDDPILPYLGGEVAPDIGGRGTVLSSQASVDYWNAFNETDVVPTIENYLDVNLFDNSSVSRVTYANGREGSQVVLYEVNGGGHVEPSIQEQYSEVIELYLGMQNHDMEMATEIWAFFKNQTL